MVIAVFRAMLFGTMMLFRTVMFFGIMMSFRTMMLFGTMMFFRIMMVGIGSVMVIMSIAVFVIMVFRTVLVISFFFS